jgi:DNA-binding PadR family transcriptional regulator
MARQRARNKAASSPGDELPLPPSVLHILLALADGDRHGYAIMREVVAITGGRTTMGPGTLYGSIRRMLADGLIEEADVRPDPALDDERRKYYRITGQGRLLAAAECDRLAQLVAVADARKLRPAGGFA